MTQNVRQYLARDASIQDSMLCKDVMSFAVGMIHAEWIPAQATTSILFHRFELVFAFFAHVGGIFACQHSDYAHSAR